MSYDKRVVIRAICYIRIAPSQMSRFSFRPSLNTEFCYNFAFFATFLCDFYYLIAAGSTARFEQIPHRQLFAEDLIPNIVFIR